MEASKIKIDFIKLDEDASNFWAREKAGENSTEEMKEFLKMRDEMEGYYDSEQSSALMSMPHRGQICIGKHKGEWHRVKVREVMAGKNGRIANCLMLDSAETASIQTRALHEAPERFLSVPYQARLFSLYGVHPVSLVTSIEDMSTTKQACKYWDISAKTFMNKMFTDSLSCSLEVVRKGNDNVYVWLFVDLPGEANVCVNDRLVQQEYAGYNEGVVPRQKDRSEPPKPRNKPNRDKSRFIGTRMEIPDNPHRNTNGIKDGADSSGNESHGVKSAGSDIENVLGNNINDTAQRLKTGKAKALLAATRPCGYVSDSGARLNLMSQQNPSIMTSQADTLSSVTSLLNSVDYKVESVQYHDSTNGAVVNSDIVTDNQNSRPLVKDSTGRGKELLKSVRSRISDQTNTVTNSEISDQSKSTFSASYNAMTNVEFNDKTASYANTNFVTRENLGLQNTTRLSPSSTNKLTPNNVPCQSPSSVNYSPSIPETSSGKGKALLAALKAKKAAAQNESSTNSATKSLISPVKGEVGPQNGSFLVNSPTDQRPSPISDSSSQSSPSEHKHMSISDIPSKPVFGRGHIIAAVKDKLVGDSEIVKQRSQPDDLEPTVGRLTITGAPTSTAAVGRGKLLDKIRNRENVPRDLSNSESSDVESVTATGRKSPFSDKSVHFSDAEDVRLFDIDETGDTKSKYLKRPTQNERKSKRLLDMLRSDEDPFAKASLGIEPEDTGVYIYGHKVKPFTRIKDTPFKFIANRVWSTQENLSVRKIQMYGWQSVLRGLNTVAIAPARSGKTLTYLFPLIYTMMDDSLYEELPRLKWPRLIIVCSSWLKARSVHDWADKLADICKLRTLLLYGGSEEAVEISLINGCDILVATPDSLNRMIDKKTLNLCRLCYLVFDDADVLTEEFTSQVSATMRMYNETILENEYKCHLQQILLFGSQWTPGIASFTRKYLKDPMVIIASNIEAAIYGKVRQECIICPEDQKVATMLGILDSTLEDSNKKTVVFTTDAVQADRIHKFLQNACHYTLLANKDADIELINRHWKSSSNNVILVVTDDMLDEVSVADAQVVIHYDLPGFKSWRDPMAQKTTRKWMMGARLWCLRKKYANPVVKGSNCDSKSVSHLLLSGDLSPYVSYLIQLIERCNSPVPQLLREILKDRYPEVESSKKKPLCDFMKAYGSCRDERRCVNRHLITKSDGETPPCHLTLPNMGKVKVFVMHVKVASCFYVRLLEHIDSDNKRTDYSAPFASLTFKMNTYYSDPQHQYQADTLDIGSLYAIEDTQHVHHRVKLVKLSDEIGRGGVNKCAQISYVDMGKEAVIDPHILRHLPPQFCRLPYQAVQAFVCRVKPRDNDIEWTNRANFFISKLISGKELQGKIVLRLGNALWLDPLVERELLTEVKVVTNKYSVRNRLLQEGFAVENPQHLILLYQSCEESQLDTPELYTAQKSTVKAYTASGQPIEPRVEVFPEKEGFGGIYHHVTVTAVADPDTLYVQLYDLSSRFDELMEDIQTHVRTSDLEALDNIRDGTLVLAKFPIFNDDDPIQWYRGKVKEKVSDNEYDVFFVDTGETEVVGVESLLPMPAKFLHLPFQAIECGLMYLEPTETYWSEEDSDMMWSLSRGSEQQHNIMLAEVLVKTDARFFGQYHYGIRLYDQNKEYDVDIAQKLIILGHAKPSTDLTRDLFVRANTPTEDPTAKLPTLCSVLLHSTDNIQKVKFAKDIYDIVYNTEDSKRSGQIQSGLITNLCNCLEYCWQPEVVEIIIITLRTVSSDYTSQDVCDELRASGGIRIVCHMLDGCANEKIHENLTCACSLLATNFDECGEMLLRFGGIRCLCKVMNTTENTNTLYNAVTTLVHILKLIHHKEDLEKIVYSGCMEVLTSTILHQDTSVSENSVIAMESVASHITLRDALRKCGGVKNACDLLKRCSSGQTNLKQRTVSLLRMLANNNRFNKEVMNEEQMGPVFHRLSVDESVSESVREICTEMESRLLDLKKSVSKPTQYVNGIASAPHPSPCVLQKGMVEVVKSEKPRIEWTQNKTGILLRVLVKGLEFPEEQVATFTEDSVQFRCEIWDTEYHFTEKLYEMIVPEKCEVKILSSEVQLGLVKQCRGWWPRLTKQKYTGPHIHTDFDRFIDSSSDDETGNDEESPLALASRNIMKMDPFNNYIEGRQNVMGAPPVEENSASDDDQVCDDMGNERSWDPIEKEYFNFNNMGSFM